MIYQLFIGACVITGTVLIQSFFIGSIMRFLANIKPALLKTQSYQASVFVIAATVLWVVLGLTVHCWLWAATFLYLDVFQSLEPALYFSIVAFTTLGLGDIVVNEQWRLLSSLTAVNGLIMVGLNTAFLVDSIVHIRKSY